MKLSSKLSLSFSAVIMLLIILAAVSWYSMNDLQRVKNLLAHTEDTVTETSKAQKATLSAIANDDVNIYKEIIQYIENARNHVSKVRTFSHLPETIKIVEDYTQRIDKVLSTVKTTISAFLALNKTKEQTNEALILVENNIQTINKIESTKVIRGKVQNFLAIQRIEIKVERTNNTLLSYLRLPSPEKLKEFKRKIRRP